MKTLEILKTCVVSGRPFERGKTYEKVPGQVARHLVAIGNAKELTPPSVVVAAAEKPAETKPAGSAATKKGGNAVG